MEIEKIKKVKLLVSLKGTRDGKQQLWLAGTVFDKDKKPFPSSIISEIVLKRIGVLEVLEFYPDSSDEKEETLEVEEVKETPAIAPDDSKEEKTKKAPRLSIKRRKPKKQRTPKKNQEVNETA